MLKLATSTANVPINVMPHYPLTGQVDGDRLAEDDALIVENLISYLRLHSKLAKLSPVISHLFQGDLITGSALTMGQFNV